jgi:hypothetical protein
MKKIASETQQQRIDLRKERSRLKRKLRVNALITLLLLIMGSFITYGIHHDGVIKRTENEVISIEIDEYRSYAVKSKILERSEIERVIEQKYAPYFDTGSVSYQTSLTVAYPWTIKDGDNYREFVIYTFDNSNIDEAKKALFDPSVIENTAIFTRKSSFGELAESLSDEDKAITDLYVTIYYYEIDYTDYIMVKESELDNEKDRIDWATLVGTTAVLAIGIELVLFAAIKRTKAVKAFFDQKSINDRLRQINQSIKTLKESSSFDSNTTAPDV